MIDMTVIESAVADPGRLAAALRPRLATHPVAHADPRTRGLLLEIAGDEAGQARLAAISPALDVVFQRCRGSANSIYVVAVNETPPGDPDHFQMRPHVDRRWTAGAFVGGLPLRTTVAFLAFPAAAIGGELVGFEPDAFAHSPALPREDARRTVARHGGIMVPPRPGTACRMAGDLPHAVLGYAAGGREPWRLAVVVAEFEAH